ncbi:hypothetical protein VP01_7846g1, partial [Puccinia sorghi]
QNHLWYLQLHHSNQTLIPPASHTLAHAIRLPQYDCYISFCGIPGIVEVLWKSNKLAHHTIGPPKMLKTLIPGLNLDFHSKSLIKLKKRAGQCIKETNPKTKNLENRSSLGSKS